MEYNDALLAALIYSNLFSFPLTLQELQERAIGSVVPSQKLHSFLKSNLVSRIDDYISLLGKAKGLSNRNERETTSRQKQQYAARIIKILHFIPTIQFIGLSGSVAVKNAGVSDDIDLFVITSSHTLWVTRFFILLIFSIFRARKITSSNLLCLNLLLDQNHLSLPPDRRDIYSAYELLQLLPIYDRCDTYKELLKRNAWQRELLPNALPKVPLITSSRSYPFIAKLLSYLDSLLAFPQRKHLEKLRIPVASSEGVLALHNTDTRRQILTQFRENLESNHLDKVIQFLYTRSDQ